MARTVTPTNPINSTAPSDVEVADMIGYKDASILLGVPLGSLYCLVHQRRVPHFRIGARSVRFSRKALAAWLDSRAVAEGGAQ